MPLWPFSTGSSQQPLRRAFPASGSWPFTGRIHRTLIVSIGDDGLDLTPVGAGGDRARVRWGKEGRVEVIPSNQTDTLKYPEDGAEVEGVIGVLRGFQTSHLLLILSSRPVCSLPAPAGVQPPGVRTIVSVLAVPLEPAKAGEAIKAARQRQAKRRSPDDDLADDTLGAVSSSSDDDDSDDDDSRTADSIPSLLVPEADESPAIPPSSSRSSALDSLLRTSLLRSTSTSKKKPSLPANAPPEAIHGTAAPLERSASTRSLARSNAELDAKILHEVLALIEGGRMFFSPGAEGDLTRSMQEKADLLATEFLNASGQAGKGKASKDAPPPAREQAIGEPNRSSAAYKRSNARYWWNKKLSAPFVSAGLDGFVLPLLSGFINSVDVSLKALSSEPVRMTIISRRSIERPGLRYQRRGVDEGGHVANEVETEFILQLKREGKIHFASFTQIRGSIPLFWSQSPWALKPPPVLERTPEESQEALNKHLAGLISRYKKVEIVNLAEQHGREGAVCEAFERAVEAAALPEVAYVGFDFHNECRGMQYGNIKRLIDRIDDKLQSFSYFWATEEGVLTRQTGIVRTNCIDCLDRTNVVQSAFARHNLSGHLIHLGIEASEATKKGDVFDHAFNGLFADNGDAISRAYAGTSALKGDFVRTGKRDWRGAVNDATNSIARLVQNSFADFFTQASIDYVQGRSNPFPDFTSKMISVDPSETLRLARIRAVAIETVTEHAVWRGETRVAGWTFISPTEANLVRSPHMEEKIVLLTEKAIYVASFEYTLQKLRGFVRIPSGEVLSLQKGPYILSTLEPATRDPVQNHGFVIRFNSTASSERVNTYSMRIRPQPASPPIPDLLSTEQGELPPVATATEDSTDENAATAEIPLAPIEEKFLAFKAMRRDAVIEKDKDDDDDAETAQEQINAIVTKIAAACEASGAVGDGFILEKPVQSAAEAQASIGLLDRGLHLLNRLVWL